MSRGSKYFIARPFTQKAFEKLFSKDEVKIHSKFGFTDTVVLAETFNLGDDTYCYNETVVLTNSGKFNVADTNIL